MVGNYFSLKIDILQPRCYFLTIDINLSVETIIVPLRSVKRCQFFQRSVKI